METKHKFKISSFKDDLSIYDYSVLDNYDISRIWYFYEIGDYDGTGYLIYKSGKRYGKHYMGHCSCFGPLEDFACSPEYNSVQELLEEHDVYDLERYLLPMAKEFKMVSKTVIAKLEKKIAEERAKRWAQ